MFSKNHRSGQITGHDIVAVIAFALALSLPFWIHEYSDMPSKLLPTRWSVDHGVASYQREKIDNLEASAMDDSLAYGSAV